MHRPKEEIGRACSQAPDSFVEVASSLVLEMASGALSKRLSATADTLGASQACWRKESFPVGGKWSWPEDHSEIAASQSGERRGLESEEEEFHEQDRRSQQQKPERQRVQVKQYSGSPDCPP